MKAPLPKTKLLAALIATALANHLASAATFVWSGASNPDLNWSTIGNWSPSGTPGIADTAVFGTAGTSADASTVNNIVNSSFLIGGLNFTNSGATAFHVTQIPAGQSLTVTGAVTVGNLAPADATLTSVYFTGGGSLTATGTPFTVINFGSTASSSLATLDLSGLTNFVYANNSGTMNIANATSNNRFGGLLVLASISNNISVNTINFLQNNASNAGNGNNSGIRFGAGTNVINVGTFNIVGGKNSGTVRFNTTTGGLRLRGVNGNTDDNSRANLTVAVRTSSGSGTTSGTLLLDGHPVDIKAGTVTIGQDSQSGGNSANGTIQFDTGTLDATTINMAVSGNAAVLNAIGNLTVGSAGKLIVSNLSMVNLTSGTAATGNLTVHGGTVICTNSIFKSSTTSSGANITFDSGATLNLLGTIGSVSAPIDNFNVSDSTLAIAVGNSAKINVATLTASGTANTINVSSVPTFFAYPAQFPIIAYQAASGDNNTFVTGTIPAGFQGYISNNTTALTIDLVITNGPTLITLKSINWNGLVGSTLNGSWDTTTKNWITNGIQTNYFQGDTVAFDDTLAGTTNVVLTTSLSPTLLTVNNSLSNYLFTGSGKISGTTSLTKNGSGTLILDNSGVNDFSGGVVINGGTLQVGNSDSLGNLPAGDIPNNGTLAFNRTNNISFTNILSGSGSLSQLGSGRLTVSGANTYSGNTTVAGGTLAVTGGGLISSSGLTSIRNGTLDISAITATPVSLNSLVASNGNVALGTKGLSTTSVSLTNSTITVVADMNATAPISAPTLAAGGATNYVSIPYVLNVPASPTLPIVIPLISYSSFSGNFNFGVSNQLLNAYITNNTVNSTIDIVFTAVPFTVFWNGGSATGSYWSDTANWNGTPLQPSDSLVFDGSTRLNTTNDTSASTAYTNITFNSGAGAFTLNGNPINGANITNNSANPQTINLGLSFGRSISLNGGAGKLLIGGGLTNSLASGSTTVTLAGSGILTNLFGGGTNLLSVNDTAGNWTLVDNAASGTMTVPLVLNVNTGVFNFGSAISAPALVSTTPNGAPQDHQIAIGADAVGTLNFSNGTFTTTARLNTGAGGGANGTVNVYGGTLTIGNQFQGANGSALAFSTFNMNGGTVNVGTVAAPNSTFFVASRGTGTLNMNSGILNCGALDVSRNAAGNTAGSVGVVNLNGGVLAVNSVTTVSANAQTGGSPTATFNFNGGTLRARASSATFFKGGTAAPAPVITAYVQANGAVIDTTNQNITIVEALQHDPNLVGTDGGLKKFGSGTLTLSGGNSYSGPTQIGEGTLLVSGSLDAASSVTVSNNATLAGTGSVGGSVLVKAGGTISPAGTNVLGTLSLSSSPTLQGITYMEVDRNAGSDVLSAPTLAYGGTLKIVNLGDVLQVGDQFTLFSASSYSGSFTISGPTGVQWDTSTLATDGIIKVAAIVNVNSTPTNIVTSVVGNQLNLSWPADHTGWRLQVQTNTLSTGLGTNWVDVPGSTNVNSYSTPISTASGAVFFRMVYP